jgi:GNAT superfamily N-acetyltransferase
MQKIANTYLFIDDNGEIVSFFSISNDCLNDLGEDKGYTNTIWNRLHRKIFLPNEKRIRQYPAIKIGRLGVSQKYQRNGLAYQLMDFIKGWALLEHKPACRLLLLDAYNRERQVKYYQRNGFNLLLDDDITDRTRIMYFDLLRLQ